MDGSVIRRLSWSCQWLNTILRSDDYFIYQWAITIRHIGPIVFAVAAGWYSTK